MIKRIDNPEYNESFKEHIKVYLTNDDTKPNFLLIINETRIYLYDTEMILLMHKLNEAFLEKLVNSGKLLIEMEESLNGKAFK